MTVSVRTVPADGPAGAPESLAADPDDRGAQGGRRVTLREPDPKEASAAPDRASAAPGGPGSKTPL
ncbi:hypothetical protein [Streptomyces erythrochromogenes]|uniref:hypothetical protein n=1 Tax=Streptomyces erythrochromogenes TaxID=285574 RepID=UPI003802C370|nr:hypothetical protein OG489_35340 [Streptomyces erythrochromogenes]